MTLVELTDYYASLLAYEYRGLSRASAQMKLWTKQAVADFFIAELLTCFDLDLAVGAQLDVIGKYVGIGRNIGVPEDVAYFGFWTYASTLDPALYQGYWDVADVPPLPAADPSNAGHWYVVEVGGTSVTPIAETFRTGDIIFSDGAVWAKNISDNATGMITYLNARINAWSTFYQYIFASTRNTSLPDNTYRLVIRFQIIKNSSDHTLASIMAAIKAVFPGEIFLVDNKDMTMNYSVVYGFPLNFTLLKQFLPRPMAVGINLEYVVPLDIECTHECETKTSTAEIMGFESPGGAKYLSRTVSGIMSMSKFFTGTTCVPAYQGDGTQGGVVPVFYFVNQFYDVTVTLKLIQVIAGTSSYEFTGYTVAPAAGYPAYPVPFNRAKIDGTIRAPGYTFTSPAGAIINVAVEIQAISGFGAGSWNYQSGVFQYVDTWDISEEMDPVTGIVTQLSNNTDRNQNDVIVSPIPGKQGDPLISGEADVAAGRPDLFYTPWFSGFGFQMEPDYATVTTNPASRVTTGLGCVSGTGFGPAKMLAVGTVTEAWEDEDTDEDAIERAKEEVEWVAGCELPTFIDTHADGEDFDFRVGRVKLTVGSYSTPLIFGRGYSVTISFGRRVLGDAGPYEPFDTATISFIATEDVYFSDWIDIPVAEGFETVALECTAAFTVPYSLLTSGGDRLITSGGARIIGLS